MTRPESPPGSANGAEHLNSPTIPALAEKILEFLRAIKPPDGVIELRGLKCRQQYGGPKTMSGVYDTANLDKMATEAARLTLQHRAEGVYYTLNPVHPDLLAVRNNRCGIAGESELAADGDILRRAQLLIDADPKRKKKISSTNAEKAAALELIQQIEAKLSADGWPESMFGDSGNGYHSIYAVDLPADDGGLIERCVKALSHQYSTAVVQIDTKVFNPSRISKLYWTMARKGDHTAERPYRWSEVLRMPAERRIVPRELLEALAATAPEDKKKPSPQKKNRAFSGWNHRKQSSVPVAQRAAAYLEKLSDSIEGQNGSDRAFHAACVLVRDFDIPVADALPVLADWNERHAEPPWSEKELLHKLEGAENVEGPRGRLLNGHTTNGHQAGPNGSAPPPGAAAAPDVDGLADDEGVGLADPEDRTELANSRRFVERHQENIRFIPEWAKFILYEQGVWEIDHGDVASMTGAKVIADEIWAETKDFMTDETVDFAVKTAKHAGLRAMINTAASDLAISHRLFDAKPMLLNCRNGTVDLTTGQLRPHRREDWLMKMAGVDFLPDAPCERWLRFLDEVFVSKPLIDFIQRLAGYFATGDTKEQVLPIFYGVGANGKTTFLTTMQSVLGDYAGQAPQSLLAMKKMEQHPTELAMLFGLRLAVASETEHNCRLAEAMVKQLTGSDKITARRMREDFWEFDPTHKLVLCTNHRPRVRGTDFGIWRRLLLVPFTQVFDDSKKDPSLPAKLVKEGPGILAWIVRGCLEWQRNGLAPPSEVQQATSSYRSEQDVLGRFVSTQCLVGSTQFRVRFSQLYAALEAWCNEIGEGIPSRKAVGDWLKSNGFEEKHSNGCWYLGLALKAGE